MSTDLLPTWFRMFIILDVMSELTMESFKDIYIYIYTYIIDIN